MTSSESGSRSSPRGPPSDYTKGRPLAPVPCPLEVVEFRIGGMENESAMPTTERLESHECWSLLRQVSVARLAVLLEDGTDIFPVNYTVDHGTVVFRTGTGTKLEAALGEAPVAMEADGVDPQTGVAWSVVVRGRAELLTKTEDVVSTFALPLFPWEAGKKDSFIRVVPGSISGRRFTVAEPKTWWTPTEAGKRSAFE